MSPCCREEGKELAPKVRSVRIGTSFSLSSGPAPSGDAESLLNVSSRTERDAMHTGESHSVLCRLFETVRNSLCITHRVWFCGCGGMVIVSWQGVTEQAMLYVDASS